MYKIISSAMNVLTGKAEILAVCDADTDVANIGTDYSTGSVAIVADGGKTYMLNATGAWVVVKS